MVGLFLTIIMFIIAVIGVFIDSTNPKHRKWRLVIIPLLVLVGVLQIVDDGNERAESKREIESLKESQQKGKQEIIAEIRKATERGFGSANLGGLTQDLAEGRAIADIPLVAQSNNAEVELQSVARPSLATTPKPVRVQYFPKDVDPVTVSRQLQSYGFQVEIGAPEVTAVPINSIWFGEKVSIDAIKVVAYILIRAGVQIKAIRPLRNPGGPRAYLIQVGADLAYANKPYLTVQQIKATTMFER